MTDTAVGLSPEHLQSSLTHAADLIREIDSAYSEMSSFAVHAARDAEEARKNARAASAVIQLYASGGTAATAPNLTFRSSSSSSPRLPQLPTRASPAGAQHRSSPGSSRSTPIPPRPSPHTPIPRSLEITGSASYDSLPSTSRRTPSSTTERLAAAHAEDVLALSLELERAKSALENEQVAHEDTKSALEQAEQRTGQLQKRSEELLAKMETARQNHGVTVDQLERDLQQARQRVAAAEEDAQMALELAKGNSDSREQLEGWLQRALQEIDVLRQHVLTTTGTIPRVEPPAAVAPQQQPKARVVRFADEPMVSHEEEEEEEKESHLVPHSSRPSRSLVAAGRQLLHQKLGSTGSPELDSKIHVVHRTPPNVSAERRRRLRNRIATPHGSSAPAASPMPPTPCRTQQQMGAAVEALDVCRNTATILRESAKRLNLGGRRWEADEAVHLESLARHYCMSVESVVERNKKEIMELESLCSLWEHQQGS